MKFAFSSLACPNWNLQTLAQKAREFGYHGVELRAFPDESTSVQSNVLLMDPVKARGVFENEGAEIACLSTSICFHDNPKKDAHSRQQLAQAIDIANQLKCPFVKMFDFKIGPGDSKQAKIIEMGHWITESADYAAKNNVTILIENQLSCRNAKDLWLIHEACSHKSVKICWDMLNGAVVGERPAIAVPLLASKLGLVQAKDAWLRKTGAAYSMLGEGDLQVEDYFNLLRGVGYTGWVSFEWEKAFLPNLPDPEIALPNAINAMKAFTHPQLVEEIAGAKAE